MQKNLKLFAAAALAVGAITWSPKAFAADDADKNIAEKTGDAVKGAAEKVEDTAKAAVDKTKDAVHEASLGRIRNTLATATEAAVTKGSFDDIVERFADADRDRIGKLKYSEADFKELDGRIAQFRTDWKAKYGKDFKISDESAVYDKSFASIETGEMGKDATLASDQLKNSDADKSTDNTTAADKKDKALEEGRNIASVKVAASHGMPELTVPLIQEAPLGKWKINVPDSVDGPKLKENLMKHIAMINDMKAQWPDDVNEASRAVSHHILSAVLDADSAKADASIAPAAPLNP